MASMLNVINYGTPSGSPGQSNTDVFNLLWIEQNALDTCPFITFIKMINCELWSRESIKFETSICEGKILWGKLKRHLFCIEKRQFFLKGHRIFSLILWNDKPDQSLSIESDIGFKDFLFLQIWSSVWVVIGNAKQIDCMEGILCTFYSVFSDLLQN